MKSTTVISSLLWTASIPLLACLLSISAVVLWIVPGPRDSADAFLWMGTHCSAPCVPGTESIMRQKAHGTSAIPVQSKLRFHCDVKLADRICNYNRHYAERSGYWMDSSISLLDEYPANDTSITPSNPVYFYDSNTGVLLFTVPASTPNSRSWNDFVDESKQHGWPSFRDAEVNWNFVRVLPNGETVTIFGGHLGHNLITDGKNRYCINLVSIAGYPVTSPKAAPVQKSTTKR